MTAQQQPRHSAWILPRDSRACKKLVAGWYAALCKQQKLADVRQALKQLGALEVHDLPGHTKEKMLFLHTKAPDAVEETLESLIARKVVRTCSPILEDRESRLRQILGDEIVVRFRRRPPSSLWERLKRSYGLVRACEDQYDPHQFTMMLRRPCGLETLEIANRLAADPFVEFAEPNFYSAVAR